MLVDSPGKGNLLSDLGAGGGGELQLCNIGLGRHNLGSCRSRPNVDHEHLVLGELRNLGLLSVRSLDSEKASEEEEVNLEVGVDAGELALTAEDVTDQTIGTAEGGVDAGSDT